MSDKEKALPLSERERFEAHQRTVVEYEYMYPNAATCAWAAWQARAALGSALTARPEYPQAAEVCSELYQVIGILADECGRFNDPQVIKALDNAAEHRLVHDDVLPFAARTEVTNAAEQAEPVGYMHQRAIDDLKSCQSASEVVCKFSGGGYSVPVYPRAPAADDEVRRAALEGLIQKMRDDGKDQSADTLHWYSDHILEAIAATTQGQP